MGPPLSVSLSTDPLNEGILLWVVWGCFLCSALTLRHPQNIGVYHGYVTTLCSLCSVDACDPQPTARIRPPGSKLHMPPGSSKSHCWCDMKKEHEKQRHFDTVWRTCKDMPWFFTTWVDQTWNSINLRAAAAHFGIVFLVVVVASGNNSLAIPLPQLCPYVDLPGSYQIYRQIPGSCSRSKDSKKGVKKVRMQEIKNKKHHHHHPAKEQQQGFAALQGSTYYVIVQSEGTLLPKQRCSFLQSYTQFISVKCWGSSRMM